MSRQEALYQSIAASFSLLIAFHGVLHEVIGPLLFPSLPETFGFIVWHGMGIAVFVIGALMFATSLHLIRFPLVPATIMLCIFALGVIIYIEVTLQQFHFFALTLSLASAASAIFYSKSKTLRVVTASTPRAVN